MSKKDNGAKKHRVFLYQAHFLIQQEHILNVRYHFLLIIIFHHQFLRYGYTDGNEIVFSSYLDSYAVMNTVNSLLHMWIMTTHPETLAIYEHDNDLNTFQYTTLDCAIPLSWIQNANQNNSHGSIHMIIVQAKVWRIKDTM